MRDLQMVANPSLGNVYLLLKCAKQRGPSFLGNCNAVQLTKRPSSVSSTHGMMRLFTGLGSCRHFLQFSFFTRKAFFKRRPKEFMPDFRPNCNPNFFDMNTLVIPAIALTHRHPRHLRHPRKSPIVTLNYFGNFWWRAEGNKNAITAFLRCASGVFTVVNMHLKNGRAEFETLSGQLIYMAPIFFISLETGAFGFFTCPKFTI